MPIKTRARGYRQGKPTVPAGKRAWSPADMDRLREMTGAGKSAKEIGAALGRTPEAVRSFRWSAGLQRAAEG